jgi:hypothetical protein
MRTALLAFTFSLTGGGIAGADDSKALEGAWRVISAEDRLLTGEVASYPWGRDPVGLILFDSGQVSIQITARDRPAWPPSDPSPEEMKKELEAQLGSYIAYFGSYTVDEAEKSLLIDVRGGWRPSYAGTKQKRYYVLEGDRLTLGPAPRVAEGGKTIVRRVTMERIR